MKVFLTTFYSLVYSLVFFAISACGLPNPLDTDENINRPYRIATRSSNNTLSITIYSYNTENNAPNFIGYNLYFDIGLSNEADIRNNLVLLEFPTNGPTILANPSESIQSASITMDEIFWLDLTSNTTKRTNVEAYQSYYFVATAKNEGTPDQINSSSYIDVYREITEHNQFYSTVSIGDSFSFSNAVFTFSPNYITPDTDTQIQDLGYHSNWFEVNYAPEFGYSGASLPLIVGHIYVYLTVDNNYGKLMIVSNANNTVMYHFSYQGFSEEREI